MKILKKSFCNFFKKVFFIKMQNYDQIYYTLYIGVDIETLSLLIYLI